MPYLICLILMLVELPSFAQSPERVNSDSTYGSMTAPDSYDLVLYFSKSDTDSKSTPPDLEAISNTLKSETFDKKAAQEAHDILLEALNQYLLHYANAVEEYRKLQLAFRATEKGGSPPIFQDSKGKVLVDLLLRKARAAFAKVPEAQQTAEILYLEAEIFSVAHAPKVGERALRIVRKFKASKRVLSQFDVAFS